ncbi:UNVERIFIED_CONTAM: hypothetical protein Slati_2473300 [Sesamum latifolium]|uniref:Uncharacterized protein n=1 Tax=Sesamum latifolium TaxID=2727402 RepID=A0AAW2WDX5_9LAMI
MQARQYPFLDSDVSGIFDDLLEANHIDLPEMKRPEEAERRDDPKYCKCYCLVGHAIQDCFVFKDKVMQLAHQGKIFLEEDSVATNAITIKSGYFDSNKDACNTTHGDDTENTLLEKEDSSDADDLKKVLGDSKPFTEAESHFADAKYYIEDGKKGKGVLSLRRVKVTQCQSKERNDSSTIEVELSKGLTLPLTQINMNQSSKPPLKGFVPSTQEEEGRHEALAIDGKGFDPKTFELLIKAGYDPKKN